MFFRSRLAKWEWRLEQIFAAVLQLETTFTSLAYITHIPLFLDIPKNLGTLPRIEKEMKNDDQAKSTHYFAVPRVKRGKKKKEGKTELPAAHNSHSPTMSHHTKQLPKSSSKLGNDFQFRKYSVQNIFPNRLFGHNVRTDANQA